MKAPEAYERVVRLVEWKLIEMPLPRLRLWVSRIGHRYRTLSTRHLANWWRRC